jgi:hypothetical protein
MDEQLHAHSPELGEILRDLVREKTPVLTGALLLDMSYEAYPDPAGFDAGESDLVWIYSEDLAQEAFWQRVYVQYQEGQPLGLHTFTNDAREMFYSTAITDGLAATEIWALKVVFMANELIVSGAGLPWKG